MKIMIVIFMIIASTGESKQIYKYPYTEGTTLEQCDTYIAGFDNRRTLITNEAIVGITCVEEK